MWAQPVRQSFVFQRSCFRFLEIARSESRAPSLSHPLAAQPASTHIMACSGLAPKIHPLFGRGPEPQHARPRGPKRGPRRLKPFGPMCSRGAAGAREAPRAGPRSLSRGLNTRHSSMWQPRRARPRCPKSGPQRGNSLQNTRKYLRCAPSRRPSLSLPIRPREFPND